MDHNGIFDSQPDLDPPEKDNVTKGASLTSAVAKLGAGKFH